MRSVVVVLPASMCAMMPMLRTLLRSVSTSCATGFLTVEDERLGEPVEIGSISTGPIRCLLPAVVSEGLVRLGHLVGVLAALDRGTETVRRVEDLVGETLGHRLLAARLRVAREPAQGEGVGAV